MDSQERPPSSSSKPSPKPAGEKSIEFPTVLSGIERQQIEANAPKKRVVYLMIVVTGIGPQDQVLPINLAKLKDTMAAVRGMHFPSLTEEQFRIDFVSDDWRGYLHKTDDIASIDSTLSTCAPEGLTTARGIANGVGVDVFYYLTSSHRQRFLNAAYRSINAAYRRYLTDKASVLSGAELYVSIFAHSLGSVICFDLLSGPPRGNVSPFHASPLEFPVHALFGCGSPIPLFLSLRGAVPGVFTDVANECTPSMQVTPTYAPVSPIHGAGQESAQQPTFLGLSVSTAESVTSGSSSLSSGLSSASMTSSAPSTTSLLGMETLPRTFLPYCAYYYNMYHPHDPVVYRIDPLISAAHKGSKPTLIPHWRTLGYRWQDDVSGFARAFFDSNGATKEASERASRTHTEAMFAAKISNRFDFELQPKATHDISNYAAMLQVHCKYWDCKDTLLFVLTQCVRHAYLDKPTPIGSLQSLHASSSFPAASSPITHGSIVSAGGWQIREAPLAQSAPALPEEAATSNSINNTESTNESMQSSQNTPRGDVGAGGGQDSARREKERIGTLQVGAAKQDAQNGFNAPAFGTFDLTHTRKKPVAGRRASKGKEGDKGKSILGMLF